MLCEIIVQKFYNNFFILLYLGLTFYFRVNGFPVFMKGSNWIPAYILPERNNETTIRDLLMSAKDAHMNMLRVWGGGIYESNYFYDVSNVIISYFISFAKGIL